MDFAVQQFIQGYLEEADEHLQSVTRHLLRLERDTLAAAPVDRDKQAAVIDELFRSFHTLKGLSGMVGLAEAADLSHAMEGALRPVQKGDLELTASVIDCLIGGVRMLENVIATLRDPQLSLPDIAPGLARLSAIVPQPAPATAPDRAEAPELEPAPAPAVPGEMVSALGLPPALRQSMSSADWRKVAAAIASGQRLTLAYFTPAPGLAAKGVNVNMARERLSAAASWLKAVPLIDGHKIKFCFLLISDASPAIDDLPGLSWSLLAVKDRGGSDRPALTPEALSAGWQTARPAASIRVDIARLDDILRLVGDLIVSRSRLAEALPQLSAAPGPVLDTLADVTGQFERQLRDLREAVVRTRMVPLAEVFGRMPLAVRDLARELDMEVELVLEGEASEIDKALVERLLDPLLHLVRNCLTHGLEHPDERAARGKPRQGRLTLSGRPEGENIVISVSDDGRGVDMEAVAARARALGWLPEDQSLAPDEALDLLCRPGFSTKASADAGAGRGVGLDIVRQAVSGVGGALSMHTRAGQGTTFAMRLPLTLAIIDAFVVAAGLERYAVPQSAVNEAIEIEAARIVPVAGGELIPYRGASLPLLRLERLFNLPMPTSAGARAGRLYGLVVGANSHRTVLGLDRLIGLREVVVRSIADPLVAQPGIAGATELGDGSVVLILDVPELLRFAKHGET